MAGEGMELMTADIILSALVGYAVGTIAVLVFTYWRWGRWP